MSEVELEQVIERVLRRVLREAAVPQGKLASGMDLLTYAEAAAEFRCGVSTLRKWAREGKLQRYGEGRNVRVSRRELLAVLAAPKQAPAVEALDARAEAILRRAR